MEETSAPGAVGSEDAAERTFLIADVRGYTRFTRERGDAAAARLASAFALLARDAVEARGGHVIELRGDEALAVFDSSGAAVRAAIELVAVCAEEAESDAELPLNVGVGIDAGEAVPVEDGFRGAALNTASRLCAKAEGGQVLVTSAIAGQAANVPGIRFHSLGPAPLKGFEGPVELIEAAGELGDGRRRPRASPRGRAPDQRKPPEPLPPELETRAPLIGRARELSWLRGIWRQARRGYGRLVFVSGPPQSGKTRLAAELAAFANSQGGSVSYVGAGGAGTALASAAADQALSGGMVGKVLVLDDLDALGGTVAERLLDRHEAIESAPVLVLGLVQDPEAIPELAAAIERADSSGDSHRVLGPLSAAEIRDLARVYAGEDVDAVPLEAIARASRGWPGRVHELLSEWADQEASRRLAAAAEWLTAEQTSRKASLEFANNVIGLKLARLYEGGETARAASDGACPYKGLASFEPADAHLFFGRERLVGELAARVVGRGLLAVLGASGSGKSSLIAAGLVPSLAAGLLPGSERWSTATMRPGNHAVEELRRMMEPHGSDTTRRVLIIDQFEEAFTTSDERMRARFIDSVTELASEDPESMVVILTLRGDFIDQCAAYPALAELIAANQVLVGPMTGDELRRAIELPARRAGVRVERALVDALVAEVAEEPGALPLLSTALVELWQQQSDGWLRMETYERTGGVRRAVARLAEATYEQLDEPQRIAARAIFMRLASSGEGESITRRRASLDEFDLGQSPVTAAVLSRLTEDRLLTRTDGMVEVAHEALLREWPRLHAWLSEDTQGRQLHQHVAQAARQWNARGRDRADLYRGTRLSAAVDWESTHAQELNQLEHDFLAASRRASERALRRLRAGVAVLAVLLLAAIAGGVIALVQRGQAQHAARVALADSLGAQAIADPHLDQAMLLAVEAVRLNPSEQTQGDLLTTVLRAPSATRTLHGDGLRVNGIAVSPDGHTLALEDNVPNIMFLDASTGRRIGEIRAARLRAGPSPLAFSPQGRLAVFGGASPPNQVDLIDPSHGVISRRLMLPHAVRAAIKPASTFSASPNFGGNDITFADGGHRMAVAVAGYAVQWQLPQGRLALRPFRLPGGVSTLLYTSGGRRLIAATGGRTSVLDARTGRVLRSFGVGGPVAAVSGDSRTMIFGEGNGSVRFLDLRSGAITTAVSAHDGQVDSVGFTPDGKTAITSGEDAKSRVWNVATHQVTATLAGHAGPVRNQTISPDGRTLYTGGFDGNSIAWDLTGRRGLDPSFQAAGSNPSVGAWNEAITPDGRLLAVGGTDGTVNVWSTGSTSKVASFHAVPGFVAALSFAPDGSLLVAGDTPPPRGHGFLRIWRISPVPHLVRALHGLNSFITWATFSPGGDTVAATSVGSGGGSPLTRDGLVAEWSTRTGRLLASPMVLHHGGEADDVSFARQGTTVAVGQIGDVVDIANPARRDILRHWRDSKAELTVAVALAPGGGRVATADYDGFLKVWNARTARGELPKIRASEVQVNSVNWSPDGTRLLTAGGDGTVRLYDASSGQQIGTSLPITNAVSPYATYSADGRTLAVTDATGRVWLYPASASGWEAYACRLANRSFTRSEWSKFVPGQGYRQVCSAIGAR